MDSKKFFIAIKTKQKRKSLTSYLEIKGHGDVCSLSSGQTAVI